MPSFLIYLFSYHSTNTLLLANSCVPLVVTRNTKMTMSAHAFTWHPAHVSCSCCQGVFSPYSQEKSIICSVLNLFQVSCWAAVWPYWSPIVKHRCHQGVVQLFIHHLLLVNHQLSFADSRDQLTLVCLKDKNSSGSSITLRYLYSLTKCRVWSLTSIFVGLVGFQPESRLVFGLPWIPPMLYTSCMNFKASLQVCYISQRVYKSKAQWNSGCRSLLELSYLLQTLPEIISESLSNGTLLCVSIAYTIPQINKTTKI